MLRCVRLEHLYSTTLGEGHSQSSSAPGTERRQVASTEMTAPRGHKFFITTNCHPQVIRFQALLECLPWLLICLCKHL